MKSKPHTVRFEESEFEFICNKEKLNTAQKVVNFLMSDYMQLHSSEKNNKAIFAKTTPANYDAPPSQKYSNDEAAMWQEPSKNYEYYERLGNTVEYDKAEELIREIFTSSALKNWQKPILQKMINSRFDF